MKPLSVTELTQGIKTLLEANFYQLEVKGEISNFKEQSSGHLYFSLKDKNAQISCVMFRGHAAKLTKLPRDGDEVTVIGEISVYAPRGGYQIVVRELKRDGLGALLLKLHEMKIELKRLGYFEHEHKKPIPSLPKVIGVITSPTGSVIQDILHVLRRRCEKFELLLGPVKVQGEGAAGEIAEMIRIFNRERLADVLIVGRGGGSLEDLWPFNERVVADAIYESEIPIISAVGHETDHTIADYVADLRAPTPSAAAEIVSAERGAILARLGEASSRIEGALRQLIQSHFHRLQRFSKHPLFLDPQYMLRGQMQWLDESENRLKYFGSRLHERIKNRIESLKGIKAHLESLHPNNVLKKGYCIPFRENDGSVIMSSSSVKSGESIQLQLHDGVIYTSVQEKARECQKKQK